LRCAREANAELVYRPMLLGGVFQATGNASPATDAGQRDTLHDRRRRASPADAGARWPQTFFPINTLLL
jgi:2-hydroxychromene-2-carboxylate isomerase